MGKRAYGWSRRDGEEGVWMGNRRDGKREYGRSRRDGDGTGTLSIMEVTYILKLK